MSYEYESCQNGVGSRNDSLADIMDMSAASGEGLKLAGSMQFGAWIGGGALDWIWWSAPFEHFQPRVELECFHHDTIA